MKQLVFSAKINMKDLKVPQAQQLRSAPKTYTTNNQCRRDRAYFSDYLLNKYNKKIKEREKF